MARIPAVLVIAVALAAAACSSKKAATNPEALPKSEVPEAYYLEAPPANARPVAEVRAAASTGDDVVVTGRVGGGQEPFAKGSAVFTLVDSSLKACSDMGEDHCPVPWDYCCEDPTSLAKHTVTVQFGDEAPLRTSARGFHGLDHLKTVIVAGKARKDDAGNVTVVARGIHVK